MIYLLTKLLMKWCKRTGRVFEITGTSGPDDVYLIRYYVIRSKYFNFFIHQFLRSDRDDLHDHPWHFMTYLVRGAYTEVKWNPKTKREESTRRANYPKPNPKWRHDLRTRANRLVFRKATDQHMVKVDRDLKREEADQAALTLCFTGPTIREWGFVRNEYQLVGRDAQYGNIYRPRGRTWIPWKTYLGLPEDTEGRG